MKKKLFILFTVIAVSIIGVSPVQAFAEEFIPSNATIVEEGDTEQSDGQRVETDDMEEEGEASQDYSSVQQNGMQGDLGLETQEVSVTTLQQQQNAEREGFVEENGYIFYYENNQMVIGRNIVVNDILYSFDQNGHLRQGLQENVQDQAGNVGSYYYTDQAPYVFQGELKVNGKWRCFGSNGKMIQNQIYDLGSKTVYYGEDGGMVYGEKKIGDDWYYFDTYSGAMYTGFVQLSGKTVYYYENGAMAHGSFEIEGVPYYSDDYTGAVLLGLQKVDDKTYYYTTKGALKGEIKIGNGWYYFDETTAEMRTGFVEHSGYKYYYSSDGTMVHGEKKIEVDGEQHWFYFDSYTGIMHTGFTQLPNKKVYYNEKGYMQYGELSIDGKNYYFDEITGAMHTGLRSNENGESIFYGKDGAQYYGEQKVAGKWRYFDESQNGIMVKNTFVDLGDKTVYYDDDGGMVYGEKKIGTGEEAGWYYFDPYTGERKTGFVTLPRKTVYYETNGKMVHGFFEIDEVPYYADEWTGALLLGLQEIDGNKYYFTQKGAAKGEVKINGDWYYFDETNAVMCTGFVDHSGHKYYYNEDGTMVHGEKKIVIDENNQGWYYFDPYYGYMMTGWVNHSGNTYYYGADGKMYHGWQELDDGTIRRFDTITGAYMPGWRKEDGKVVYYVDGVKCTGERKIDGYWYYFNPEDGEMATGWTHHSGNRYFYDSEGRMVHGWYKTDPNSEEEYFFGYVNGIYVPGFKKIDGDAYFYLENGEKYTGEKKIDGNWYYFDPKSDGKMTKGWCNLPGKKVYYDSDGIMVHGEKKINGEWYYFNRISGAMTIGWCDLPGKKVYYDTDGTMVHGTKVIGGKTYYFDPVTGALITNAMTTKAQVYSSATNWLILVDTRLNKVGVYQGARGNWREVYYWPCTSGAAATPTVKGQFTVRGKGLCFGSGYTCWYYTQFYGNYLFHSVLYQTGSQTALVDGRLGINASHGCVRLSLTNAKWIYDNIPIGTKVVIY